MSVAAASEDVRKLLQGDLAIAVSVDQFKRGCKILLVQQSLLVDSGLEELRIVNFTVIVEVHPLEEKLRLVFASRHEKLEALHVFESML